MASISVFELRELADERMQALGDGNPLDRCSTSLITLAVAVSVTSLDDAAIARTVEAAFDAGASVDQVTEIVALASGLGVHSLMASASTIVDSARRHGLLEEGDALDAAQQALWDRHVGDDPFWQEFSAHLPGFLDALLRLSPDLFTGFFDYCAIPWRIGSVKARIKELAAMACDATPTHRFLPGFHVHLSNAIKLGAGQRMIRETLSIAAAAPSHEGYR